jgi:hypothetical protein
MDTILRVAGSAFLIVAVIGVFWTLPIHALAAAFFGLVLLGLGEGLARLGKPQ